MDSLANRRTRLLPSATTDHRSADSINMNPVVIVHLLVAGMAVLTAVPLIARRVKMNQWYGVRISAAFVSEERWFEINHYGGRLMLVWGLVIAATAAVGAFLPRKDWAAYDWASLVVVLGGLAIVIALICRHARETDAA
jgi:hypothetical protein